QEFSFQGAGAFQVTGNLVLIQNETERVSDSNHPVFQASSFQGANHAFETVVNGGSNLFVTLSNKFIIDETVDNNEQFNSLGTVIMQVNETERMMESWFNPRVMVRLFNEAVHEVESFIGSKVMARIINETEEVEEEQSPVFQGSSFQAANRAFEVLVNKAVLFVRAKKRMVNETEDINEDVEPIINHIIYVDETVDVNETILPISAKTRIINEVEN